MFVKGAQSDKDTRGEQRTASFGARGDSHPTASEIRKDCSYAGKVLMKVQRGQCNGDGSRQPMIWSLLDAVMADRLLNRKANNPDKHLESNQYSQTDKGNANSC
ncbi:hypothetical protein VTN00DRAFT_4392 [Thermoascus crustaceus]|uniref:uncharacterized protein n=1 Tax=Thermoascus crustaceus TaxID=5088 RepID=UPI003742CFB0